ncbi:hypothetical protein EKO04_003458 [Ascochyta lentis]|uniref:Uncharacterized protein n=1 Tax=Ascochyta lentis TaxID=205686 RepID=A0A8H7MKC8_9PLEO|nr:hypothetical protein EKO04_003458 [Ascochyta lentis]
MMLLNADREQAVEELAQLLGQQQTVQAMTNSSQGTISPMKELLSQSDQAAQQFIRYLGSRPTLQSLATSPEHERSQQVLLVEPQEAFTTTVGSSTKRAQGAGETPEEPNDMRSLLIEAVEDPWGYAKTLFSDRLLQSSNHEDILVLTTTSARYLEQLEKELASGDVKQEVVDFALIMGALAGVHVDDEASEESTSNVDSVLDKNSEKKAKEAAELEFQVENGEMHAQHPFVAITRYQTARFTERIWTRGVVASLDD